MSGVKSCPLCGDNGFIKVSTRRKPSGEWDARMKCEECGIELVCSGATEDDALTAVLMKWNTRAERTCHNVMPMMPSGMPYPDSFICSACGAHEDGVVKEDGMYCYNCGARVVSE